MRGRVSAGQKKKWEERKQADPNAGNKVVAAANERMEGKYLLRMPGNRSRGGTQTEFGIPNNVELLQLRVQDHEFDPTTRLMKNNKVGQVFDYAEIQAQRYAFKDPDAMEYWFCKPKNLVYVRVTSRDEDDYLVSGNQRTDCTMCKSVRCQGDKDGKVQAR